MQSVTFLAAFCSGNIVFFYLIGLIIYQILNKAMVEDLARENLKGSPTSDVDISHTEEVNKEVEGGRR